MIKTTLHIVDGDSTGGTLRQSSVVWIIGSAACTYPEIRCPGAGMGVESCRQKARSSTFERGLCPRRQLRPNSVGRLACMPVGTVPLWA